MHSHARRWRGILDPFSLAFALPCLNFLLCTAQAAQVGSPETPQWRILGAQVRVRRYNSIMAYVWHTRKTTPAADIDHQHL